MPGPTQITPKPAVPAVAQVSGSRIQREGLIERPAKTVHPRPLPYPKKTEPPKIIWEKGLFIDLYA